MIDTVMLLSPAGQSSKRVWDLCVQAFSGTVRFSRTWCTLDCHISDSRSTSPRLPNSTYIHSPTSGGAPPILCWLTVPTDGSRNLTRLLRLSGVGSMERLANNGVVSYRNSWAVLALIVRIMHCTLSSWTFMTVQWFVFLVFLILLYSVRAVK